MREGGFKEGGGVCVLGGGRGGGQDGSQGGKKTRILSRSSKRSHQVTSHDRETHEKTLSGGAISRISEPITDDDTIPPPSPGPVQDPRVPLEEAPCYCYWTGQEDGSDSRERQYKLQE